MSASKRVYFPNLDSLRTIAFLLVFLQHGFFNAFSPFLNRSYFLDRIINLFFLGGGTGVQIFFVLSGFLITFLIITEIRETDRFALGKFYLRRMLRIWPLYYATIIFGFIIYPLLKEKLGIHSDLCSTPWYYYSFLANFDSIRIALNCPGKDAMMQGIVWSVAIEEQFYLVWPLLFLIFRKQQVLIFGLVLAACLSFRIYNLNAQGPVLYFHTLSVMGDLAIGGLAAYLIINKAAFLGFWQNLPKNAIRLTYCFILLTYFFSDKIFQHDAGTILSRWFFDLAWVFIILEQNFAAKSAIKLGRIKLLSSWGKYTYGLYLLHPIGILIVDIAFRVLHVKSSSLAISLGMGLCALAISLVLARISYRYFEMPFLRLKERLAIVKTTKTNENTVAVTEKDAVA